jgi:hypothetical protein
MDSSIGNGVSIPLPVPMGQQRPPQPPQQQQAAAAALMSFNAGPSISLSTLIQNLVKRTNDHIHDLAETYTNPTHTIPYCSHIDHMIWCLIGWKTKRVTQLGDECCFNYLKQSDINSLGTDVYHHSIIGPAYTIIVIIIILLLNNWIL